MTKLIGLIPKYSKLIKQTISTRIKSIPSFHIYKPNTPYYKRVSNDYETYIIHRLNIPQPFLVTALPNTPQFKIYRGRVEKNKLNYGVFDITSWSLKK